MAILRAYVLPAYSPSSDHDGGGAEFTLMPAVLSAEGNEDARSIIADAFDPPSRAFFEAIVGCVPVAPRAGLVCRSEVLLGAHYSAFTHPDRVTRLSAGALDGHDREIAIPPNPAT